MLSPSTPAQYALILIDMVENQGIARAALLEGTSLAHTGTANIGARVDDEDFYRLTRNAYLLTGDPALGLKLGLRLNLSAHAVLGQAIMTCKDLGETLDLFLKYYHLLAPSLQLEFDIRETDCALAIVGEPEQMPVEFGYELVFGALINTLRGLLDMPDLSAHMEFPYPEPDYSHLYREVFGHAVHFDSVRARVVFPIHLLDAPLPLSNPALRDLYEAECARLLADLEGEDSVAERTLRLLRKLEGQYPQMPQIAAMLNLSPRTYRRRLDREGHAFQQLLDQVRSEHATRYLQNTRLPLSSIAYMVGFSDASNFRRAYTKWTGRSPREVRNG
ncbi:MAG: AraC family transcriptional regulator [Pseudomonadota bacterium]